MNKRLKTVIVLLLIISIIVVMAIITYVSPMQRKLMGSWNVELEHSYISCIERDSICIYQYSWTPINIEKDSIKLPMFLGGSMDTFFEYLKDATGTWRIISTNPDSIFINAPKNPLHGKYAVRFFIDKRGWVSMNMGRLIYKMELTNDSTHLICNKGGVMYTKDVRDWEGKN